MSSGKKFKFKNKLPPFVPLLIETLDSPAWRALSHGAKCVYISLKRRFDSSRHNNGKVYLSQRHGEIELRSGRKQIARWFRELEYYGFIVKTTPGCLGVDGKGKSPHWRLTELGIRHGTDLDYPTRDFTKWDGIKFRETAAKRKRAQNRIVNLRRVLTDGTSRIVGGEVLDVGDTGGAIEFAAPHRLVVS